MARIRSIKPSFFRSEDVSVLPLRARLTWIGLWTHCDDAGRTKDNVKLIKGDVWPLDDVSLRDIEQDLETLADHGRIVRYEVDGKRYLEITNWRDHQAIQKPTPSKIPPPSNGSGSPTGGLPDGDSSTTSRKGREGSGREGTRASALGPRPNPTCAQHQDDPDPPACRRCKTAREAAEAWDLSYAVGSAMAEAHSRDNRPKCRKHRGQLAHNCAMCRSEALAAEPPPATDRTAP